MTMPQAGAIADAALWVDGVMTGSLALGLATLGVAGIGFAMLSGRFQIRRGIAVIVGCFLILGAPAMARGIMGMTGPSVAVPVAAIEPPPRPVEAKKVRTVDDPYAGASLVRH